MNRKRLGSLNVDGERLFRIASDVNVFAEAQPGLITETYPVLWTRLAELGQSEPDSR